MSTVEKYLNDLDAALSDVRPGTRETIVDDIRAHIDDALEDGRDAKSILAALGTPEDLARNARDELGAQKAPGSDPADRAQRILYLTALVLAVVTAVLMALIIAPGVSAFTGTDLNGGQLGFVLAMIALLPALLALLPLALPARWRPAAGWTSALLFTAFSLLSALSEFRILSSRIADQAMGQQMLFYLPLPPLFWAAVIVPSWIRRGRGTVSGRIWRIVGALTLAFPVVVYLGAIILPSGPFEASWTDPWFYLPAALLIITILFGIRLPYLDAVVALLGVVLIVVAWLFGDMITLGIWWVGEHWLAVGMIGIAARGGLR